VSSIYAQMMNTKTRNTTDLTFTINASNNTAALPINSVAAGYYTLNLQMKNGSSQVVMGTLDIVRIVAGQQTSGAYAFNAATGQIAVTMNPTPNNPIVLGSFTGIPTTTITPATDFTAKVVATDNTANANYTWSLNGVPLDSKYQTTPTSTSSGYNIGALDLAPGYYRLDVIAITNDGTRAGSQNASFLVSPSAPFIVSAIFVKSDGTPYSQWVRVASSNGGSSYSNATVTVNGSVFTYTGDNPPPGNPPNTYMGNATILPGAAINLSVTVNGGTYTATGTQYTTSPSISTPTANMNWSVSGSNTIKWSAGSPSANAHYVAGIIDSNGNWVWPSGNPAEAPITTSPITLTVGAGSLLSNSSYTVIAGIINGEMGNNGTIASGGTPVVNAQSGSAMVFGVGAMVPINTVP